VKKHKNEIIRWATSDIERVWQKAYIEDEWTLTESPSWCDFYAYVVDDEYAEIKKAYIDGRTVQISLYEKGWCNMPSGVFNEIVWYDYPIEAYRIMPIRTCEEVTDVLKRYADVFSAAVEALRESGYGEIAEALKNEFAKPCGR